MNTVSSLVYTVGRIPENSWATPFAPGPPMATVGLRWKMRLSRYQRSATTTPRR